MSLNIQNMLLAIATMYIEKRDELSKLDSVVGDGDHGISMARGAKAAYKTVVAMGSNLPICEYFRAYGRTLILEVGGAIGPLFGIIFIEFGRSVRSCNELTAEAFVNSIRNSLSKIMSFGGAKVNDKTMVDAMVPAVEFAEEIFYEGGDLLEIVVAASDGAKKGVDATVSMRSRKGRSKFLQDHSIGYQDAGATSFYYLMKRIADFIGGETTYERYKDEYLENKKDNKKNDKNTLNKFLNNPENVVSETVEGYVKAYSDRIYKISNKNVVARKTMTSEKVGVVIGNGSGHEPACLGFVGENMLDANAYGHVFAAPDPYSILEAIKISDQGHGVCVLISNHAGDVLNSKIAIDMAENDGIKVKGVILYDDVASAPKNEPISERRGSVGTIFNYKMTSSYSNIRGKTLEEIVKFAENVRDNTRSIVAAISPGTSPITGEPMFEISPGEIMIGLGIHGESALLTLKNEKSFIIAKEMVRTLTQDKPFCKGDEVAIIVNSTGQTTMMELMIFYSSVESELTKKGIKIYKPLIGSFITTQEMGGIGLAMCKVDDEMKKCWTKPTNAPNFPVL